MRVPGRLGSTDIGSGQMSSWYRQVVKGGWKETSLYLRRGRVNIFGKNHSSYPEQIPLGKFSGDEWWNLDAVFLGFAE